ncbi:MAG: FKBP-type peptidyl-prolyl cis-trans isomerase [Bacteroidales bacterium]|jgi:FKBP-type peptidyl-prolyl cis-trans isomerase SlyD|nr:FKBP-type peptidyl-prolyl cis-trans isomerase [Bacteroidales bacterium]
MKIETGKTAIIQYRLLNADDGAQIEATSEEHPAVFKFGTGQLIPEFEKNLTGLTADDIFDFTIESANAYGPVDPYAIFDIPLDTFEVDGKIDDKMIRVGNIIPMTDNEGNKHLGRITKIMDHAVTMNFNHPLAGQNLHFIGKILEVKS